MARRWLANAALAAEWTGLAALSARGAAANDIVALGWSAGPGAGEMRAAIATRGRRPHQWVLARMLHLGHARIRLIHVTRTDWVVPSKHGMVLMWTWACCRCGALLYQVNRADSYWGAALNWECAKRAERPCKASPHDMAIDHILKLGGDVDVPPDSVGFGG